MFLGGGAGWNRWRNLFRRSSQRDTTSPKRVIPAAVELAASRLAAEPNGAGDGHGWLGKRVVQRESDFVVRSDEPRALTYISPIRIYVVKRASGQELWLKPERIGASGWAAADRVLPIEEAREYFTKRVAPIRRTYFRF
jgi:hypothetical protein